ncbi:MAG: hypothetical protein IPM80_04800 [Proteobacteria bacterium]|nr:hypothetical protein [Pseudomonadota bacterium]
MKAWRGLLLVVSLWAPGAFAGHGLMNSFSALEWLPPPGRTPDQWNYALDTWRERMALRGADKGTAFTLCLAYMRDKLADIEAMVTANNVDAARLAAERYRDYRERAMTLSRGDRALGERLARALLEHQYMLSVDYPDLPAASREPVAEVIEDSARRYAELRRELPRAVAESLFFKEEEVRWSWQMARQPLE